MPIPSYQDVMLPLLRAVADGKEHAIRNRMEGLADHFDLSDNERREFLPSGQQRIFDNRVHWARLYLVKAMALSAPRRGQIQITPRGQEILAENLSEISNQYLGKFPEFLAFQESSRKSVPKKSRSTPTGDVGEEELNPHERMEWAYDKVREELAEELLATVKKCSPTFFENLVIDVLISMGYGGSRREAAETVGRSGDEGIDGIINEDKLGLEIIYIQAKRWENVVGRPEIQKFVGALHGKRAKKGVFITTSHFSKEAVDYTATIEPRVILLDGIQLTALMMDYDIGVSDVNAYVLKQMDADYFET